MGQKSLKHVIRKIRKSQNYSTMDKIFGIDDSRNFQYFLEPQFWHEIYTREDELIFLGEKAYAVSDRTFEGLREELKGMVQQEAKMYGTKSAQILFADQGQPGEFVALARLGANGKLSVIVAAVSQAVCDKVIEIIDNLWPPSVITREDIVPFWFWTLTGSGPHTYKRKLEVCSWNEITNNYQQQTREHLDALMNRKPPFSGGHLILWHGAPGTGKTHGIRALCHRWNSWCKAQYIMDPDRFFQNADYMMEVMMGKNDRGYDPDEEMLDAGPPEDGIPLADKNKWNLIIVEDADEFLHADAKLREGQALSRLLNTTDGLIGQGLKVLILITTNVEMRTLHPAIHRAGRCMSNIEFIPFNAIESAAWLKEHGDTGGPTGTKARTLADLYETLQQEKQIQSPERVVSSGQYL